MDREDLMETMMVETIKPSSATPQSLRTLHLSMLDYGMHPSYTLACFFYKRDDPSIPRDQTTLKLKTSLSETLTKFYPFAGRIKGVTIECNDEGAILVEASLNKCTLSDFLKSPDAKTIQKYLLPLDLIDNLSQAAVTWPLLLVKATYLQCGGMTIGICMSHKLADAASLSTFVRAWAATARGESHAVVEPEFAGVKLYPPANLAFKFPEIETGKRLSVTKRFLFSRLNIEELRNKATIRQQILPRPTRVECVTALLWRCVIASSSKTTCTKMLGQPANLRNKIPSLLSQNLIGNIIYSTMTFNLKNEIDIQETVKELRERAEELTSLIQEGCADQSTTALGSKLVDKMVADYSKLSDDPDGHKLYEVSSWCKLPFYETDFGTGPPVWVFGSVAPIAEFVTFLLDSNDLQGIEAWVTLAEEDMALFEQNPELLAFASPSSPVFF
ncbi:unnamed protein product [Microthlaspi erraticum]|uniref:BAHD acyltransferase n=1 Tax=Microthlaspi erraticum TaxID=1685480 RepID=A0A6D2HVP2_9BRAS|nr:unnamed protein product [Microthlaspi erraticum]